MSVTSTVTDTDTAALSVEDLEVVYTVRGVDRAIAQVLADHGAIFGFDQAVVVALPRSAFGLFDQ